MKVALFTVGCKLNQYETQAIAEQLEECGFERVDFTQPAEIYIINTCTVTKESDYSSRQAIYRAKRRAPQAKIVVTGCYAQLEKEFLEKLPGVSVVLKQEKKGELANLVANLFGNHTIKQKERKIDDEFFGFGVCKHAKHTRALVKIQDGCDKRCSYCVVPLARGKEKSRGADSILFEVTRLMKNGYREVVLTGVHIGRYNKDGLNLALLTERILKNTKVERLRFSSIDPKEFSDELIDLISKSKRIARHLHIPLQSGDDHILSLMKRDYHPDEYRRLLEKIKSSIPEVMIGADVIVGFPGETDKQFENTYQFILSSPLSYLHVFSYSDRKGTASSQFTNKVPPQVIHKRSEILHDLGRKKWEEYLDLFIGKTLDVLIEQKRDKKTSKLSGLSGNYIRVLLDGEESLKNRIIPVSILRREGNHLIGRA
ncbi:MAG: tRNA (N(6)-L-threonylcarbamoyladenosine(37)-C(2))-methylthiotransferase MtaB [Candidatus Zixiibacteriota bacterium]